MKHQWLRVMGDVAAPPELTGYTFEVTTTAADTVFTLRTLQDVNYDVDWGDSSADSGVTSNTQAHTYVTAGTYTVTVETVNNFRFYANNTAPDAALISAVIGDSAGFPWRPAFGDAWEGCSSLTSFPLIRLSVGANLFVRAWQNCSGLVDWPAGFFDNWTGSPGNNCFTQAWQGCNNLSATSVENILNSIDTSGRSAPGTGKNITIDYNASSGTPSVATAVTNLKSRGWTIPLNGVAQ